MWGALRRAPTIVIWRSLKRIFAILAVSNLGRPAVGVRNGVCLLLSIPGFVVDDQKQRSVLAGYGYDTRGTPRAGLVSADEDAGQDHGNI